MRRNNKVVPNVIFCLNFHAAAFSPLKTAEMRAVQGVTSTLQGAYIDVRNRGCHSATLYCAALSPFLIDLYAGGYRSRQSKPTLENS